jgi:hypothetical protein
MELLVAAIGLLVVFWFKDSIKSLANLVNNAIRGSAEATEDTLEVYVSAVKVDNGKKRGHIVKDINKAVDNNTFATQKEIEALLRKENLTSTSVQDETESSTQQD